MLAYCDYIADRIKSALELDVRENRQYTKVNVVGKINMDLHPIDGYMLSTKKTIGCTDINGKMYKITVEEL
jgi:hypothetical protein